MTHCAADTSKLRQVQQVVNSFQIDANNAHITVLENGHINDTFLVQGKHRSTLPNEHNERMVLQRINTTVFPNASILLENFRIVTRHIHLRNKAQGVSDLERRSLSSVLTTGDEDYLLTASGEVWRATKFIDRSRCLGNAENNTQLFNAGYAFGNFVRQLSSLETHIANTIDDFHNTSKRFKDFERAVYDDKVGRASEVRKEIEFAKCREYLASYLFKLQESGAIPTRIVHNDAKISNLLFDSQRDDVLCVIDLDTVMNGVAAYDYGEIIRTSVSDSAEDQLDLAKIRVDMTRFESITDGFIRGMADILTSSEVESLIYGPKTMTFENGIRFLTDYLNGDVYFKTHRPKQNLDRCRAQFELLKSMELNTNKLDEIIRVCCTNRK